MAQTTQRTNTRASNCGAVRPARSDHMQHDRSGPQETRHGRATPRRCVREATNESAEATRVVGEARGEGEKIGAVLLLDNRA